LKNVTLKTPTLTQPLKVQTATLQFAQNSMSLANVVASLGSTNANGNVSVTNFAAPHLTFNLSADKVNVTELEQITSGSPNKRAGSGWSLVTAADAAPASKPSMLDTMTGNGTIAVNTLTYQQTVLTAVRSNVALNRGLVQLNPLSGQIFGGQAGGSIN